MKIIYFILLIFIAQSYLPYQAHGFNDFDLFLQLLRKGIFFYKKRCSSI
jgi:hypothetical protein